MGGLGQMVRRVYLGLLERTTKGPQEREPVAHSGAWSPGHLPALCLVPGAEPELMVTCHFSVKALGDITSAAYPNNTAHPNRVLTKPALVLAALPQVPGMLHGTELLRGSSC